MRGGSPLPGLHTMRITEEGVQVSPRILKRPADTGIQRPNERLALDVPGLDEMLGGGIPSVGLRPGHGSGRSGKSVLAAQFIAAGLRRGDHRPHRRLRGATEGDLCSAPGAGFDLENAAHGGRLEVIYMRPLDLSVDEALLEVQAGVRRLNAQRLVIDSLSGFELALAPTFRQDFGNHSIAWSAH